MPYVLSPLIEQNSPGMWPEGSAYEKNLRHFFGKTLVIKLSGNKYESKENYFMSAFPLPFKGASESPVVPVLFTREELLNSF